MLFRTDAKKRVLILMSDTGGGHRAAAEAIRDALYRKPGANAVAVELVDVFRDYSPAPFQVFAGDLPLVGEQQQAVLGRRLQALQHAPARPHPLHHHLSHPRAGAQAPAARTPRRRHRLRAFRAGAPHHEGHAEPARARALRGGRDRSRLHAPHVVRAARRAHPRAHRGGAGARPSKTASATSSCASPGCRCTRTSSTG